MAARGGRAERVVTYGRRYSHMKIAGPIARRMRDFVFPFFLRLQARRSGRQSLSWLFDHRLDWNVRFGQPAA